LTDVHAPLNYNKLDGLQIHHSNVAGHRPIGFHFSDSSAVPLALGGKPRNRCDDTDYEVTKREAKGNQRVEEKA
jgi:hypothetical protein